MRKNNTTEAHNRQRMLEYGSCQVLPGEIMRMNRVAVVWRKL